MELYQLIIPSESAHETLYEVGELGLLEFKDLNKEKSAFQRTYASQVKRCEELQRKLRYFSDEIDKAGITKPPASTSDERTYSLDELEVKLESMESEMLEMNENTQKLQRSYNELIEVQMVVEKAGAFFEEARADARARHEEYAKDQGRQTEAPSEPLLYSAEQQSDRKAVQLGYVTGVISTSKLNSFERVLFRATRGNMYLRQAPIEGKITDPASGEKVDKTVFCVFSAGERARSKITKICEAFQANRYPFPEEPARQRQMSADVMSRLREIKETLDASISYRDTNLRDIANNIEDWTAIVKKQKAIYHTLNKLSEDVTRECLIAEAWAPSFASNPIQEALARGQRKANAQVSTIIQPMPTKEMPPTYFDTDKVTSAFQSIVDAYGVANYKEANPALFSIVTFPFLFAVMFGDFGHGILMLLAALYMVLYENRLKKTAQENEIFGMMYGGRYIILLMSVFSIYVGALYNECMALPMTLFGPSVYNEHGEKEFEATYPFGLDPMWQVASNKLTFVNSLKMKASVVLGVVQMTLGIFHSMFNHVHFKDYLGVWFEFIPQLLLLLCVFGYLSLLIVLKWSTPGAKADLYGVMINMFMSPGNVDAENELFEGQAGLQVFFLLISVVSIPWMLLPKPLILKHRYEKRLRGGQYGQLPSTGEGEPEEEPQSPKGGGEGEEEDFNFGEYMIHQLIHTIEFVIGVVSNTASYLRLWALSLAHAQLSEVFYKLVLMTAISTGNVFYMMVGAAVFASATFGVLMVMESLSAFLHCLRLHWVEFQNKFYNGEGHPFKPFSFQSILESEDN